MASKIFIDINILIDFLDPKRLKHIDAAELLDKAESGICMPYATESVLNTVAYLVRKDFNAKAVSAVFEHLLTFLEIIPVYKNAYQYALRNVANDVEDAVLYQAALENNIDYFITNDLKDFRKIATVSLPVKTAAELLKLL